MQLDSLSWFPGHMTKTRRMITAELGNVDAVCEILDARIPMSSRNPDVDELTAGKPRLIVLNRVDQADPEMTKKWAAYFRSLGCAVIETDAKQGGGVKQFSSAVRTLLHDKIASYEAKGQIGRVLRVMVLGIPNVGKSTFIKRFMETQIIPNIDNVYRRERAKDELPQSGSGRKEQTKSKADKEAAHTPLRSACSCSIERPPMAGQGRSPCALWGFQRGYSLR